MCLILFEWRPDSPSGRRLTVAANRDEFFHRPARPLHAWPTRNDILAPVDLGAPPAGGGLPGTWIGVTRGGRFAALTNVRGPQERRTDAPSRGELVTRFLAGSQPAAEYLLDVQARGDRYNGFNLLVGETLSATPQLWWISNRGRAAPRKLLPGIYGLSNASLDTPWPKLVRGVAGMSLALAADRGPAALFDVLSDTTPASEATLPATGVPIEWERLLSPIFIASPSYGTRSSLLVRIEGEGRIDLRERSYPMPGSDGSGYHDVVLTASAVG